MKLLPLPPLRRLRDLFSYDSASGHLIRKRSEKRVKAGDRAGYIRGGTHRFVKVGCTAYAEHRICWALHYGREPSGLIDHINGNCADNRINNLRLATSNQNQWNVRIRSDNSTGYKGVCARNGKYYAYINCMGKRHYLGTYITAEEAHEVYTKAAVRMHGEFALPTGVYIA